MLKGIYYKEFIKTRYSLLWMLIGFLLMTVGLYLYVTHRIATRDATYFWIQQMVTGNLFFAWLLPLFPLAGIVFAIIQFLPETVARKFRLSLFLPQSEFKTASSMVRYGFVALLLVFATQCLLFAILFSRFIPPVWLWTSVMVLFCFWLVGLVSYLVALLVFMAQTMRSRIVLSFVMVAHLSVFFNEPKLGAYYFMLPYYLVLILVLYLSLPYFVAQYKNGSSGL